MDRVGFEPTTSAFSGPRYYRLSYLSFPTAFPLLVQASVEFRVTPTTEQNTLPHFGQQLVPPSQQPSGADLEPLGGWVAVVETVSARAVLVVAADPTASAVARRSGMDRRRA